MCRLLIALILLSSPTPPPFTATWARPGIVRVAHGPGCLYKGHTFIACYDAPGVLMFGDRGPMDAAYRGRVGDVFRLVVPDGSVEQTTLRGVVYLPALRR